MTEQQQPDRSASGKPVAIGIVSAFVIAMLLIGGIGYHHATRNKRQHAPGSLTGQQLYGQYCAHCHGNSLKGDPTYPSLIGREYSRAVLAQITRAGSAKMPAFKDLDDVDIDRLLAYITERRAAPR